LPKANNFPKVVTRPYPAPLVLETIPITWQFVSGLAHGGMGGAGVQHDSFCSAVALSTATAVVHEGSTVHGGTHATTRHTMRPTQGTFWLHWP
jgi:hypothetical protein